MCTKGPECKRKGFRPEGCQVMEKGEPCAETDTLDIAKQFKRCYEEKMRIIEADQRPEAVQEKMKLQREWIDDLQEQNELLISAVQELEYEASERVQNLEEKLKQSAKCICEVMKKYREHDVTNDLLSEPLQRIFQLENDQKSLIELLNRGIQTNNWNLKGLRFFTIEKKDIFDSRAIDKFAELKAEAETDRTEETKCKQIQDKLTKKEIELEESDKNVKNLELKIQLEPNKDKSLKEELECLRIDYENVKRQMEEMRRALTEEVAAKHDMIILLKRDIQQLEERCLQADKQTAFKDDIIKELRKEIKQLKQQSPEAGDTRIQKQNLFFAPKNPAEIQSYAMGDQEMPLITINHNRRTVESGKSTVIYIHKESSRSSRRTTECVEVKGTECRCSTLQKGPVKCPLTSKEPDKSIDKLHSCKSEGDLSEFSSFRHLLKPVREKSKYTASGLSRHYTFADFSTQDDVLEQDERVVVPSRTPVKTYVNNFENKT